MPINQEDVDREKLFRRLDTYLRYPGEVAEVEYKRAAHFRVKTDFAAELIRTILGMTNAGGGTIVIGFVEGESKQLVPDENLSNQIAHTFESANITVALNRYIADTDQVNIEVFKRPLEDKEYPIIVVRGFKSNPIFCTRDSPSQRDKKPILEKGALYIRVPGARTIKVAGPGEWQHLVEVCVRSRQQQILTQLSDLLKAAGIHPIAPHPVRSSILEELEAEHRPLMQEELEKAERSDGYLEVVHVPITPKGPFGPADLRRAAQAAECKNMDWPIGVVLSHEERKPKPIKDGIQAIMIPDHGGTLDYWFFKDNGAYYFARTFEEDTNQYREYRLRNDPINVLAYDTRTIEIAEAFYHAAKLYYALKIGGEIPIGFKISHRQLADRIMIATNTRRARLAVFRRTCHVSEVHWNGEVALDTIIPNLKDLTFQVISHLFEFFDFVEFRRDVIDGIVDKFLSKVT